MTGLDEAALGLVAALLERFGIAYMVTGSLASSHHGRPRLTNDVDIVIDPTPASLLQLVQALEGRGFYVSRDVAEDALRRRRMFNVIGDDGSKVDLIICKDRPFSREELRRGSRVQLGGGTEVVIATPEDTILAKLEWAQNSGGSERQLADVSGILDVHAPTLDTDYVEHWARELGVSDLWELVRQRA